MNPQSYTIMSETSTLLIASPKPKKPSHLTRHKSLLCNAKRNRNNSEDYLGAVVINRGKRKRSIGSKSNEDVSLDLDQHLNLAIAKLDSRLIADYIAKQTKRFAPDLSLVELEERYISGMSHENFIGTIHKMKT